MKEGYFQMLFHKSPEDRKKACKIAFIGFATYYFFHWFQFSFAPFHTDFFSDVEGLFSGELIEAIWIAFRESAKTTIAKIMVIYAIAYEEKHYINWDSYDKDNSEAALFDIVIELQTNKRLIADFGHLYTQQRSMDEVKRKRVTSFITSNNIKVEAFSTQESTRGRVHGPYRPDMYVIDDFETIITRKSVKRTKTVIAHIKELREGLSADGIILYLANYISEIGSVEFIRGEVKRLGVKGKERFVAVERGTWDKPGKPTWPGKYAITDREQAEHEKKTGELKVSLEAKRRKLGKSSYNESMLNSPDALGQPIFDRKKCEEKIAAASEPLEEIAGLRLYGKYNASHRYALGADVANGVSLDSSADVIFDFSTVPAKQVSAYDNNEVSPSIYAHELKNHGNRFGACLIAPEKNNDCGGACLNELITLKYPAIYQIRRADKTQNQLLKEWGWRTTSANRQEIILNFRDAWHDGLVEVLDIKLLKEMKTFSAADLANDDTAEDIAAVGEDGETALTRHFDLLKAAAIAWEMRKYAVAPRKSTYEQKPFESSMPIDEVPDNPRANGRDFGPQHKPSYAQPDFQSSAPDVEYGV